MISIDKEKFLQIVDANKKREEDTRFKGELCIFYEKVGLDMGSQIADIVQSISLLFKSKNFTILELPLKDKEISAFYFDGDMRKKYIVLNSSLSISNNNFAILHEAYHVLFREKEYDEEAESYLLSYDLNAEEACANTFAGVVLLPEDIFKKMYKKIDNVYDDFFKEDNVAKYKLIITHLMAYFKATYMSVLIRCYELELIQCEEEQLEHLLMWGTEQNIRKMCKLLLLNDSFLNKTGKNDFDNLFENISNQLDKAIELDLIDKNDLEITKERINSYYRMLVD